MQIKELKPRKALNKAFLKVKPNRNEIELFKANLIQLLDRTNDTESEEFHKNLISDFLKNTYYKQNHFINTKGRNDLVIHTGNTAASSVGVIIEAKKPTNKSEMISRDRINVKAFQELVLYYLRERVSHKNLEVKYLVVTNINEWFIFDAVLFDRIFSQNKKLVSNFIDFEAGRLSEVKTDFFYRNIAQPFIAEIKQEIEFTYFDIRDFKKALFNEDKTDDNKLISLFKLLSPEHLLKLPFVNDSNNLDRGFYSELLHLIGLTETKVKGKKLIDRNLEGSRNTGSILEDAIIQLDSLNKINRLEKPNRFGLNHADRLFNVALELSITWINRILFLKLLEAQLINYHSGDKTYAFLNFKKIKDFDDLNSLFFQVLAERESNRNSDVKAAFAKVPYLNSSLFEPTSLEQETIFISNLKNEKQIPIISSSVLKNDNGKKLTGDLTTLEYLFRFLDSYDFTGDGGNNIQEENKSLINASVLGLIFEKINGYKDGSFFTPGFITMYMSRETIRESILRKFNETKNWNCVNFDELYDKIEDRNEANNIVNTIKICDPAVGSGHFLVSALNEIISVKNDLKILQDRSGKRLKEYSFEVVNDEIIITDDEGDFFEYKPLNKESQRIQEALFHEKQTIIENCLFGVDINPNSVKICRLRLWIELLKNAYYKNSSELETLPNIDINIKCGNSLVSRFSTDADLQQTLKKNDLNIDTYKNAVNTYRNAESKQQKYEMESLITKIKSDFRAQIHKNDRKVLELNRKTGELFNLLNQQQLFGESRSDAKARKIKREKLEIEITTLTTIIDEIRGNKIYENAFEWRFEFPEVLNQDGVFEGFDLIIGNPPYLTGSSFKDLHSHFSNNFKVAEYQLDLYTFFIELSQTLLKPNGTICLITPNSWLKNVRMVKTRKFILDNFQLLSLNSTIANAFSEAQVDTSIFSGIKNATDRTEIKIFAFDSNNQAIIKNLISQRRFNDNEGLILDVEVNAEISSILKKIRSQSVRLEDCFTITRGVNPYDKYRGQSAEIISSRAYHAAFKKDETFLPELKGKHVSTFNYNWDQKHFISYGSWLAAARDPKFFTGQRLVLREIIGKRFVCAIIEEDFIIDRSLYIAVPINEYIDVYFILGVLCSKLVIWLFKFEKNEFDNLFPKIRLEEFKHLPIPKISQCSEISELSRTIVSLKINNQDATELENKLDLLIYQLYDLSGEEIQLIESI
ncbi:DUF7149 domain-containing protein [Pedobacter sp. CFBP9032]|uniref:DUF7149 domain-containing protein n=1 Tax=Pedobacter sp. CFBP9032 TaxID=3096539 RepID=UPI002A6A70F4|nr:TaqI-like C-terminal specificity domain-containing protein [Pedobacter sp. CFBP9032]MDY0905622.1 Eco57I restriction-modification methylase domain-containing protein [Pedobacter sp. CFBP9032]